MIKFILLLFIFPACLFADSLQILFLGDTHFGENYQYDSRYNHGTNYIASYGYDGFFKNVEHVLKSPEAVICNLETPLTREINIISSRKPYLHWSDPDSTVNYFKKYNITFASLGNNHIFDMGQEGFNSTAKILLDNNIPFTGAGNNLTEASKPLVLKKDDITAVIFSGFEYRPNYDTLYNFYAGENNPGVNLLDTVRLNKDILEYKKLYPGTLIIIYPHWGSNYGKVNERQIAFAHSWINAGADAIIGQGAHTVQPVELYNGKYIYYNIGNFIFNAPGRYASTGALPYSMMVKMQLNLGRINYTLFPLYTDNKKSGYQLRQLNTSEVNELIEESFGEDVKYLINKDGSVSLIN